MDNIKKSIESAKRALNIADHFTNVTYSVVKENKILLKILEEISKSLLFSINAILQNENIKKNIQIYSDSNENYNTFTKIAQKYNISYNEVSQISKILSISMKHKKSACEFTKDNKLVILSDNLKTDILTIEIIKNYLNLAKEVLKKTETL